MIGYVDKNTGNSIPIPGTVDTNFEGTRTQWNAMTQDQQAQYDTVDLKDDYNGITMDDTPTQNSENTVKSGGVYNEISSLNNALTNKVDVSTVTALSNTVTNNHKVTLFTVDTTSWTADSTSQSGSTLYKKTISLSHVYVDSPSVDISTSSGTGLPTVAQQEAYDLLQYATVNGTTLTLYANAIPTATFYIQIEGVD